MWKSTVIRILNDFYRGNLSPADKRMVKGSEMAQAMEELSKAETVLEQSLPAELLPVLKRLTDAQLTLNALTAETYYIDGFKTGARFIMDVYDNTYENLKPIKT